MCDNPGMLITDAGELARHCGRLASEPYIAVDTEFMRERTYRADLCLIQICGPDREAIAIDPMAEKMDLSPLLDLLADEAILKVFHAARQDVEIFFQLTGSVPRPIYDTQIAAMVCGFGEQVGFGALAATLANAPVDKSSQYSDWSLRPLSDRQLKYALDDVIHLCTIYEEISAKLKKSGREPWLTEEMAILTDDSTYVQDPYDAWQRVKHRRARPRALAVLRELAAWREKRASRTNVPRGRVVRDEALAEIASSAPRSRKELTRIRGLGAGAANGTIGDEILNAVENGLAVPESDWPSPARRIDLPEGSGELIALLQALLKLRCEEQDVAPRMVATRDDLEKIVADPDAPVRALSGWRRELFGEDALALLRGEIGLTGARGGLRLLRLNES